MRVSRNWLRKYVAVRLGDAALADRLTMAGLEVEGVTSQAEDLSRFVVGEVMSVEKHTGADRLSICVVFDGKEALQVVCGAPNVAAGQKVAFAPVGATIPNNQHDPAGGPFTIGRVKIRGVESSGMICSGFELGISEDREGILVLNPVARPGTPLSRHLNLDDTVFDIGVTANRPDLLSHIGIAREISAFSRSPLKIPRIELKTSRSKPLPFSVKIEDPANCPRYSARVVSNIKVGPSPGWLQDLLNAVGIRPINNVVDVTNYVLMEIGQPLHAFDYTKLAGHSIIVRSSGEVGRFTTLDGKERNIDPGTLLICDGEKPVALAGVMGGENSEISDSTKTVVLESAYFNPTSVRRTSKRLGISTEASHRFERGTDPDITLWAVNRAAQLLTETAGGVVQHKVMDIYPRKIRKRSVRFNSENSNKLLGITLSNKTISGHLKRIGIDTTGPSEKGGSVRFSIPTWRPDITREVDLIEEVARLHGYENIPADPAIKIMFGGSPGGNTIEETLRNYLSSAGYQEVVTNSMRESDDPGPHAETQVRIANPISKEMATLRTDLLQSMLTVIKHNIYHGVSSSRFFEIGRTYLVTPDGDPEDLKSYNEEDRLIIAVFGLENPVFWGEQQKECTIFTLKGECNTLIRKISLDNPRYIPYSNPNALSERSIFIEISGQRVGMIGSVSTRLLKRFDIETEILFMDISLDALAKHSSDTVKFMPYPKYPVVSRDLAVVVDESVSIGKIEDVIRQAAGDTLGGVELFDIYRGDQLDKGKKSCAFSIQFVPRVKTLDQNEIQAIMGRITERVTSSFNAVLRQ